MGRHLELTEKRIKDILEYVKDSVPLEVAAGAVGIDKRAFWRYLAQGKEYSGYYNEAKDKKGYEKIERKGRKLLRKFYHDIEKANCIAQAENLQTIKKGKKDWTARAWILERRYPKIYGRRTYKPEEDVKDENINVTFNKPTTDPKAKGDSLIVERDK